MNKIKPVLKKLLENKRKVITLLAFFVVFASIAIFVNASSVGSGTNRLSSRLSYRLDLHTAQVAQNLPSDIAEKGIPLYSDAACTQSISHYLLPGDWVVYKSGSNEVTYPITVPQNGGADEGLHYTTHYIPVADKKYLVSGTGSFSGTDWSTGTWYKSLPTTISYTSILPGNGDTIWVGNNTGNFNVVANLNGYYDLWSGDALTKVMSADWSQFCYYDTSHSDFTNADYTWNLTKQPWSTTGLKQGKNTVYYAGMDASGNYLTGSRALLWDTAAPKISTTTSVTTPGTTLLGLESFIERHGHNGWLNSADYKSTLWFDLAGTDDSSVTKNISGVKANSLRMSVDSQNAFGKYMSTSAVSDVLGTTYYTNDIATVMDLVGQGSHTLYLSMLDNAKNTGVTKVPVKVDTVAPSITFQPDEGRFNSSKEGIAVNASFSDYGSSSGTGSGIDTSTGKYQWVQDGNTYTDSGWRSFGGGEIIQTQNGVWTLYVEVSDKAGNTTVKKSGSFYCGSLTGEIVNPEYSYGEDEDVIASVKIHSNDSGDITQLDNASVTFVVRSSTGAVITNQTKALVVPDNGTQLIWYRFHTPSKAGTLTLTATINSTMADAQTNPFSITHNVVMYNSSSFDDMPYTTSMQNWFKKSAAAPTAKITSGSWQEWTCQIIPIADADGNVTFMHTYTLHSYSASVSASLKISADPDDPTYTTDSSGHVTQKSGYGFKEQVSTSVKNTDPDSNAVTAAQLIYGLYPEWNYQGDYPRYFNQTSSKILTVASKLTQTFNLQENPKFTDGSFTSKNQSRVKDKNVHFTPIAFPDGTYTAQITATDVWTPAGRLDNVATDSLTIKGNLEEDWNVTETTPEAIKRKH
jgi:hypothetical protein